MDLSVEGDVKDTFGSLDESSHALSCELVTYLDTLFESLG